METAISRWKEGLSRTRQSTFGKITAFLGASQITDDDWALLEEILIQADLGVETSLEIISSLKDHQQREGIQTRSALQDALEEELLRRLKAPPVQTWPEGTAVILLVGVNGSGKTTTLAKLGKRFQDAGKRVLLGAADTYRAAAVEQLEIWGDRLDLPVISGQRDGDPGAVTYDAIQSALARQIDFVLIDTAGRLHTRYNLMEELKKVYRVAGKALQGAPHASWLVLDATTGQNALHQAAAFQEAIPLDGVILAKLDSSAKGGMVFAIQKKLNLPVLYAGLGEKAEDLEPFNPQAFVHGILNGDQDEPRI